ncbi:MAG TPA: hypothetical protein VFZ65_07340 [Planctomycetota bacterium]|nr:hypothetical protein [Planctomycetota bacterium]
MNEDPDNASVASPVFVEDLFLTDVFLIKGRLPNKQKRLTNLLEDYTRTFLPVQDATLVSLRNGEVIRTPTVMVNVAEVILAHELVEVAGDEMLRRLAGGSIKTTRIRAFYNGPAQFELAGQIETGAYESQPVTGRKYFIMQKPVVRGLDLSHPEMALLKGLDYAIVRKDRMAYVYDFG